MIQTTDLLDFFDRVHPGFTLTDKDEILKAIHAELQAAVAATDKAWDEATFTVQQAKWRQTEASERHSKNRQALIKFENSMEYAEAIEANE